MKGQAEKRFTFSQKLSIKVTAYLRWSFSSFEHAFSISPILMYAVILLQNLWWFDMDVPENEKELFSADDRPTDSAKKIVQALGVEVTAKPADLHIYINGKDVLEHYVLDTLLITVNKPVSNAPKP